MPGASVDAGWRVATSVLGLSRSLVSGTSLDELSQRRDPAGVHTEMDSRTGSNRDYSRPGESPDEDGDDVNETTRIRHHIRTGRDVDNNLYMQIGKEPVGGPNGDRVIGHICHGATARDFVEIVNRAVDRRNSDPAFPGLTGADLRRFSENLKEASKWSDEQDRPAPDWDGLLAAAADTIEKLSWAVDSDGRLF